MNPTWKIATLVGGALSAVLALLLFASYVQNRDLTRQKNELSAQIYDPQTGYAVRVAQAQTNVATLKTAIETERQEFAIREAEQAKLLADTRAAVAQRNRENVELRAKVSRFLATKPQGATLEDRIRDIDQRALSELVE